MCWPFLSAAVYIFNIQKENVAHFTNDPGWCKLGIHHECWNSYKISLSPMCTSYRHAWKWMNSIPRTIVPNWRNQGGNGQAVVIHKYKMVLFCLQCCEPSPCSPSCTENKVLSFCGASVGAQWSLYGAFPLPDKEESRLVFYFGREMDKTVHLQHVHLLCDLEKGHVSWILCGLVVCPRMGCHRPVFHFKTHVTQPESCEKSEP